MNTNVSQKRILCFGDSNTWGYISGSDHERFTANIRWPGVLQSELGSGFEIIEEALNSRSINREDPRPGKEGRNAIDYIIPCLDSHDPLDWIVVMLGTNDLKFDSTPEEIAEDLEKLLSIIERRQSQFREIKPTIILIAPPLINDATEYARSKDKYSGTTKKSQELSRLFEQIAKKHDLLFLDASTITEPGVDGVHITQESHNRLGIAIANLIK